MIVKISNQITKGYELFIEREKGIYNNCNLSVDLSQTDVHGLTDNEIKTLAWLRVKPIAIRVFEEIEPLDEKDNPIGFKLVPSVPKRIQILGSRTLFVGDTTEYQAEVYDQYGQEMRDVELIWDNKYITATEKGNKTVTACFGDISESFTVSIIERPKTRDEILQELVDQLLIDNLNMQQQIDTLITTNLEV